MASNLGKQAIIGTQIEFNKEHFERIRLHKLLLENNMNDPTYIPNNLFDRNIIIDEICSVVDYAKSQRADMTIFRM